LTRYWSHGCHPIGIFARRCRSAGPTSGAVGVRPGAAYVSPKIELSNQRQEKVDLRVLPVIFRFEKKDAPVYPGQLVDVYIGQQ